jgi:hypothetical protein
MARPSEYDFEMCKEICELIANGANVIKALESNEIFPNWTTFRRWKNEHDELNTLYVRAIQDKAIAVDAIIDDTIQECKEGKLEYQVARLMVDTYKWKAAKYYPKMFGDKTDITSGGEKIITTIIDYSKLSTKALEEIEAATNTDKQSSI